jgi:drug/metabolite transporter (DMT)-like permease
MVLVSGLLLGLRIVYTKRLTQGIHPGKLLLWQGVLSIPAFLLLSLIFEGDHTYQLNSEVVFGILYQGLVIAGFGFMLHTILLKRYVASQLGVFHFATPVFGVVFSNIFLGEAITIGLIGSIILVGVGITIVNYEN